MLPFPGNDIGHADAVLRLDRRLKGSGSPCCFWVCIHYLPASAHRKTPPANPEATDGRPLPFSFLQAGCSKVYITSRKAAACDSACAALNALPNKRPGAQAIAVPADSANIADIQTLVRQVMKTTDHVDILLANAGASWGEKFDTHPDSAFAKVMDLNVKSVFNTIRLCVPFAHVGGCLIFAVITIVTADAIRNRFASLLQKNATMECPSRVIVTASIAGLGVGSLGENATFGYSASKGIVLSF